MARQSINIGSSANDGTGDPLRTAFDKINDNFVELYGSDNDINTLDANLDVSTFAITTGVTNGDITVTPNGTGSIKLGAMKFVGTTMSSDDSTQITIAENIQTTGTLNVTGATTLGSTLSVGTSLALATGATVTGILDEDNMSTDSATQLATQQSIKAYVDSQVATANELSELTDTNITSAADGSLLFYDTATSKWIDNVVSGDITIADTGVATIAAGAVDNAMLAGSIENNKLVNDSVSFGGVSVDLGASDATPAFDLSDATNYPTSSLTGTITNAQLAGSIDDSKLNTITTADKVSAAAVQVDGATDGTGSTLANTDKLIVDDAGTSKYINASQVTTFINTNAHFTTLTEASADATALAIALG